MTGVLALLSVLLAGYFVHGILRIPSRAGVILLEDVPAIFGLGAGALFLFFLALDMTGRAGLPAIRLSVAMLGALWLSLLLRRRTGTREAFYGTIARADTPDFPFLAALAILLLVLSGIVFLLPLYDWETRILWALKARILAAEPTISGAAFRDPYLLHLHPRYPLLVPFLVSWMARNQGAFREWHFQLLIGICAFLAVWQLHLLLRRMADRRVARTLTLVMALTGVWLGALFGSRIEAALVLFLLLAVDRLYRWLETEGTVDLVLAGVFLYCGAMTKNEGMLLALCAVLAFFPVALRDRGSRAALRASGLLSGVFLLLSAAWFAHLANIPPVSDEQYLSRLRPDVFLNGIGRLPQIALAVLSRATDLPRWHLLWLTPPAAALALYRWRHAPDRRLEMAAILASLYFTGLLAVYAISPWRDIALHVEVTFDRVALPLLPLFLLMIAQTCGGGPGESR